MTNKPVKFSFHAREQLSYRGASESEVVATITENIWQETELGRLNCRKDFSYNEYWNGKHYKIKQVRPIFVEEMDKIVVVTVYVYYY